MFIYIVYIYESKLLKAVFKTFGNILAVPRLRGRLGQVRCRKASWGCFGGRHLLEFFVALCFGRCGQMKNG